MCAHQVIYLPPKDGAPKGTVYVIGGLDTMSFYQPKCFKFDVERRQFSGIPDWPN